MKMRGKASRLVRLPLGSLPILIPTSSKAMTRSTTLAQITQELKSFLD